MLKAKVSLDLGDLDALGDQLVDAIDLGVGDSTDRGFQRSQELVTQQSFDEGTLLKSGHILKPGQLERIIEYAALQALYVEYGATYKDKMPPLEVIYKWVRRHQLTAKNPAALAGIKRWLKKKGIIQSTKTRDADYWAIAFYIAKDIQEHGLEPRPFMRPAAEEIKAHLEEDVQKRIEQAFPHH